MDKIPAKRAKAIGLANHVCPDDEVPASALAAAHKIARLPRQAVETPKGVLSRQLERAVLATIDLAHGGRDRVLRRRRAARQRAALLKRP